MDQTPPRWRRSRVVLALLIGGVLAAGSIAQELRPVPDPTLEGMEPAVQEQLRSELAAVRVGGQPQAGGAQHRVMRDLAECQYDGAGRQPRQFLAQVVDSKPQFLCDIVHNVPDMTSFIQIIYHFIFVLRTTKYDYRRH